MDKSTGYSVREESLEGLQQDRDNCLEWNRKKIGLIIVGPVGKMDSLYWDSEAKGPVFFCAHPSLPQSCVMYNSIKVGAILCTVSETNILEFKHLTNESIL